MGFDSYAELFQYDDYHMYSGDKGYGQFAKNGFVGLINRIRSKSVMSTFGTVSVGFHTKPRISNSINGYGSFAARRKEWAVHEVFITTTQARGFDWFMGLTGFGTPFGSSS